MKKIKTAIIVGFLITTVFLFNRCEKMLNTEPQGKLSEAILTSKEAVDQLLISAYKPLNGYVPGVWGITSGPDNWAFADMVSGNTHKGSTTGDLGDLMKMERFEATADNGRLLDKWKLVYGAVERCNSVLRAIKKEITGMNQAQKEEIEAETRFLRGYYHSEAKKIWNMVPYIDENVEDIQRRVPNTKDIWPDIEADFKFAIEHLPPNQAEPGRPTKYAAQASLASVYLFQQKFGEAKPLLEAVINSGKYQLMKNYHDVFNVEYNNNIEAVWENECAVNIPGAGYNLSQRGSDLSFPNAPELPALSGAGFNQPTFDFVNACKTDENGLPLIDSYAESDFKNDMGIESSTPFTPDNITPIDPRLDWIVGRRGIPYHDWGIHPGKQWIREQNSAGPYNQKKYLIHKSQLDKYSYNGIAKFNAMSYNIIRYAAVLLWAAEVEVEIGDPETARGYVNMIRKRARDGNYVTLGPDPFGTGIPAANYQIDIYLEPWTGQSKEWMRKRVRFEERIEFGLEGHYFFDLVRWGIAEETLNKYFVTEQTKIAYLNGVNFKKDNSYFPIPLSEIQTSYKDGEPTLIQNPGY